MLRVLGRDTRSQQEAIAREAISRPVPWEADVRPVPMFIDSDLSARPAAIMLAAGEVILHSEVAAHPPSDAAGVAALLVSVIDAVLTRGGAAPSMVRVRHPDVATELGRLLRRHGVASVDASPFLPTLDDYAAGLRQHIAVSRDAVPAISNPEMWAAWNLPAETLDLLFASAAAFYAAAPWQVLAYADALELAMPNGSRWFADVPGSAEQFGLVLYESLQDFLSITSAPDAASPLDTMESVVITLAFDTRADLPKPMRREIADARWPIAGPSAFPNMWTLNTIGGGVSDAQARDLAMALDVIGRFPRGLTWPGEETTWIDEPSGTIVRFAFPPVPPLWKVPSLMSPSLAQGARANASALWVKGKENDAGDESDAALVARFAAAMSASGASEQHVTRDRNHVAVFISVMHACLGVRLPALTEFDLRVILYDLLPRKMMASRTMGNVVRSALKRFVQYLAANEDLVYPWANSILRDKFAFEVRWDSYPGGDRWDAAVGEWMAELYEDLEARAMLPSRALAGFGEWGATSEIEEPTLRSALQREWLVWRDAEIALGARTPDELHARLSVRQAAAVREGHYKA